jgi:acyl-CoA thioester hydrolase
LIFWSGDLRASIQDSSGGRLKGDEAFVPPAFGYPRHTSCFLPRPAAEVAPQAVVSYPGDCCRKSFSGKGLLLSADETCRLLEVANAEGMLQNTHRFRIRYGETDRMGNYFNSHALTWFEVGRTELSRAMGLPYAEWEKRGVLLPVVEAHLNFRHYAGYDEELEMTTSVEVYGRARLKFANRIVRVTDQAVVCEGYTVHATVDSAGRPMRVPQWALELMAPPSGEEETDQSAKQ